MDAGRLIERPIDSPERTPLVGRERDLARIGALLEQGEIILLYGRVGVGKSAVLRELAGRAHQRGMPYALATRTASLADFTSALSRAYPAVSTSGTQRQIRSRLRMAVEARPGVLLFDDLGQTGTAFKGALHSVRGMGLGIVLAADVDQPRDHDRIRALGLTYREIPLRPLHGHSTRALLEALLERRVLPHPLAAEHFRALAAAAAGLPGRAVHFAEALVDPRAWLGGRPRVDWLRTGAAIQAAERYRLSLGSC